MRKLFNYIKIFLALICLISALVLMIITGVSAFSSSGDGESGIHLPFQRSMLEIDPISQFPNYPTGCESTSLTMLLRFYGVNVSVDEVIAKLPKGNIPYESDGTFYGANPEHEFVGSPYDENSYGVFNRPIAEVANEFKSGALTTTGASISQISQILKSGHPVMAWFTSHPDEDFSYNKAWYAEDDGTYIEWPSGEHAVVVCGEDLLHFYYADPYTGNIKKVGKLKFRKYFKKIGGRVVYYS